MILMAAAPCWSGDVELEWIGHAAFSVKSQLGAKVVIDPYDSNRWVGYRFPFEAADADALLITHAHYDHDASYYFPSATPVMRRPGEYRLHDIRIQGFQGRHAGDHAESFGNRNTVWVLETGGVRILHTGDNQALSDDLLHSIGGVDVWLVCVDDKETFQSFQEVRATSERLGVRVLIPMHYEVSGLSPDDFSMGGIDRWLAGQPRVRRVGTSLLFLPRDQLPASREVWVLSPHRSVRKWSGRVARAWELSREGKLEAAHKQAPEILPFAVEWGESLIASGEEARGQEILEQALLNYARADHEYSMRARLALARLFHEQGKSGRAAQQYQFLLDRTERDDWRAEARSYLLAQ